MAHHNKASNRAGLRGFGFSVNLGFEVFGAQLVPQFFKSLASV